MNKKEALTVVREALDSDVDNIGQRELDALHVLFPHGTPTDWVSVLNLLMAVLALNEEDHSDE